MPSSDTGPGSPERRLTALFADISGFTTLAHTLDADALHETISPVIRGLAAVAERHGGLIAKYAGDALLVFFEGGDAPAKQASERRAAEQAARAALEMHRTLEEMLTELPEHARHLELHIGVATGAVVDGSGEDGSGRSILGNAVSLAQRLESLAPPRTTLVSATAAEGLSERFRLRPAFLSEPGLEAWWLEGTGSGEPVDGEAAHQDAALTAATQALHALEATDARLSAPDERRLVTALFADIATQRGRGEAAIAEIVDRLAAAASRYEGFVAPYAGDALLVFFGAPVAHEDDPARALLLALDMHAELERMRPSLPPEMREVQMRIGINSGHVVSGLFGGDRRPDYSILGDAVNLSQRLESVAPPGATFVGESTHALTKDRFEFESTGPLMLKGKPEPVHAWRLIRERDSLQRVHPRAGRGGVPLIGRAEELAAARSVLERLATGQGGLLWVVGDPGIGKSRLMSEVRQTATSEDVRWLEARCISYGSSLPYWPFADLVRRAVGVHREDDAGASLSRLTEQLRRTGVEQAAPFFARLIGIPAGEHEEQLAALEPEAFRRGLHDAFARWIRALASAGPVALWLEDVHWADSSSAELTRDLARLSSDVPLALLLTGRREAEPLCRDIVAPGRVEMTRGIDLQPLGEAATAELVEWLLGGEPPRGLPDALHERTGGNPFFVEEVVRSLQDAATLVRRPDGRWHVPEGWDAQTVPATVDGVLSARIDLLPRATVDVLQTAAVMGRRVRVPLLSAIVGAEDLVEDALTRLVDHGFLDPLPPDGERALLFHHALIVDVAYSRLLRRQRQGLHLKVAEMSESLYGAREDVIDFLARHYYLGNAGPRALPYLVEASVRARRLFANEEAIEHLERAVEVCRSHEESRGQLPTVLLDLADLKDLRGRYEDALLAYREVRDSTGDARGWRGMAAIARKRGQYAEALRLLDEAQVACEATPEDRATFALERGWTLGLLGRYREGIETMQAALDSLPTVDDPIGAQLLLQLAVAEAVVERFEDALAHTLEARAVFERVGDERALSKTMRVLGDAYLQLGRLDESATALLRALELAERVGVAEEIGGSLINLSLVELRRTNFTAATESARRAIEEFERIGHEFGRATGYGNMAESLLERGQEGDLEQALVSAEKGLQVAGSIGYTLMVADIQFTLASIKRRMGRTEEAARHAEEAGQLFSDIGNASGAAEAFELAAALVEEGGDAERARGLASRARSTTASG